MPKIQISKTQTGHTSDIFEHEGDKSSTLLINSILNSELSSEKPFAYEDYPYRNLDYSDPEIVEKMDEKDSYENSVAKNLDPKEVFPVFKFCNSSGYQVGGKVLLDNEIASSALHSSPHRSPKRTFSVGNFAIGENHKGSVFSKNMIVQSLQSGRKYFFLEQFPRNLQTDINGLLINGNVSENLSNHCKLLDSVALDLQGHEALLNRVTSYQNIISAFAKKSHEGVRVFAMDPFYMNYRDSGFKGVTRVTSLNYMFEADFSKTLHEGYENKSFGVLKAFLNGEVMVFAGNAHLQVKEYEGSFERDGISVHNKHYEPGITARMNRAVMVHIFYSCFDDLIATWSKENHGQAKQDCELFAKKCDFGMVKKLQDEIVNMIYNVDAKNWLNTWVGEAVSNFEASKEIELSFEKIRSSFFVPVAVRDLSLDDESNFLPVIVDAYKRESEMEGFPLTVSESPYDNYKDPKDVKIKCYEDLRSRSIAIHESFLKEEVQVVSPDKLLTMKRGYVKTEDCEEERPAKRSKIDFEGVKKEDEIKAHPANLVKLDPKSADDIFSSLQKAAKKDSQKNHSK